VWCPRNGANVQIASRPRLANNNAWSPSDYNISAGATSIFSARASGIGTASISPSKL